MSDYSRQRRDSIYYVADTFSKFIQELNEADELSELEAYIPSYEESTVNRWNKEKAKIVLELLKPKNNDEVKKILSYLEHSEGGWQGGTYHLYNDCLRFDRRCRQLPSPYNTEELAEKAFVDIEKIFLHKEYGRITTYLFGYCLAALFSSRLKRESLRVPYFLQIACERNSNTYRMIHEIVDICDVNTGILEHCYITFDYGYCDCNHVTIFPTQSTDNVLDSLLRYRDIPVIVDGYESEKLYGALLRETANISGRISKLDRKDRLNVLPIFLCSSIKSSYRNVFSIDLTNLDIDTDYMKLLEKNKRNLASWVFELVMNAKSYFKQRNSTLDKIQRKSEDERPIFDNISAHINQLRVEYRSCVKLEVSDFTNVGYLTYFISRFMNAFRTNSICLTEGTEFVYRCRSGKHNPSELIEKIGKEITDVLFVLHNDCSPVSQSTVSIKALCSDPIEAKAVKKKGTEYARNIIKFYQSYGVSINILPDAEYKDDRYVFQVRLLPGTDRKLINKYSDEVRRLLNIDFFFPDISSSSIRLIASEKPLKENSLIKILESRKFRESKMDIPYAVGYDLMGEEVIADISEFPHLLIGGATNSGKSSAVHSLLMSIVYKQPADKVKLLLMDFGASRLKMFKDVPHMLTPGKIISDIKEGRQCILKLQALMEDRQKILDSLDVRDYDKQLKRWPSIICVIDEFPAFIKQLTEGKGNKDSYTVIEDLLNRARKTKVHLILVAQDTTKGGIGIKNTNLTAGIAFRCTSWHTSKAIIGEQDAVHLTGKGAMYFRCDQYGGISRLQGSYMAPEEIIDVLDDIKFTYDKGYNEVKFQSDSSPKARNSENNQESTYIEDREEEILLKIVEVLQDKEEISNNQLKRGLKMGYSMAERYLARLEAEGIVGKLEAKKKRPVYRDKVKEFLKNHGYVEDESKGKLVKTMELPGIQSEVNVKQKQDITFNDEVMNSMDRFKDFIQNTPGPKKQKTKVNLNRNNVKKDYSR